MKKLFIFAFAAIGLLACSDQNSPLSPTESSIQQGMLSGEFSVNPNKKVHFSQGNLQYQASTNTWRFAGNQIDFIGYANKYIHPDYDGWIDLFGWGTGHNPTQTSQYSSDYKTFIDWGVNQISNGGNTKNQWRTLTIEEWRYIITGRTNAQNLFAFGVVSGVNGMILLPDNWDTPSDLVFYPSTSRGLSWQANDGCYHNANINNYNHNTYTSSDWLKMELAGAVFFPASGQRVPVGVYDHGNDGYYWLASQYDNDYGYLFYFNTGSFYPQYNRFLYNGFSVRLVQDIQ